MEFADHFHEAEREAGRAGHEIIHVLRGAEDAAPELIAAARQVLTDVALLAAAATLAAAQKGGNVAEDLAVLTALNKLLADYAPVAKAMGDARAKATP